MKTRRLITKDRKVLNREITGLTSPNNRTQYFESIPLDQLFDICRQWHLEPLQEDNTPWDGFLCGRQGQCSFRLGDTSNLDHPAGPCEMLEEVKGGCLQLSWYKMESGRYEIVSYVM